MNPSALSALLIVAALLAADGVWAQAEGESRFRFEYRLEEGLETRCPDEELMVRAVSGRLEEVPFAAEAQREMRCVVRTEEEVVLGRVEVFDEEGRPVGERTITSDNGDCQELADALALAIAIAVDPMAITRPAPAVLDEEGPPPPPEESAPPPPPGLTAVVRSVDIQPPEESPTDKTAEAAPEPEAPPGVQVSMRKLKAGGGADLGRGVWFSAWTGPSLIMGLSPAMMRGNHLGLGVGYGPAWIELEGVRTDYSSGPVLGGKAAVLARATLARANVCVRQSYFFGCGGGRAGSVGLAPMGVADPPQHLVQEPHLGLTGRLGLDLPVFPRVIGLPPVLGLDVWSWFRLRLYGDLEIAVWPHEVWGAPLSNHRSPPTVIWSAPPVNGAMGLAFVVSIP